MNRTDVRLFGVKLGIFSFALGIVSISGCYTVLKHSEVVMKDSESDYRASITYRDQCASCHTERFGEFTYSHDAALYSDPNYDLEGPISTHDRWWYYYENPWWYDNATKGVVRSGGQTSGNAVDNTGDNTKRDIGNQRGTAGNTINIPPPVRSSASGGGVSTTSSGAPGSSTPNATRAGSRQDSLNNSTGNDSTINKRADDARTATPNEGKTDTDTKRTTGSTRGK
jgi:hypothetical protein